jgi:CBS domain-containing protein
MIVSDIMHSATIVEPEMSVSEAAKLMRKKEIGSVLVRIHSKKWGMVTERDILNKVVAEDIRPTKISVKDIMTDLICTIDADAPLEDASETFNREKIRRLPVMDKGKIVGIITSRDVAKRRTFTQYRKKVEYSRLTSNRPR